MSTTETDYTIEDVERVLIKARELIERGWAQHTFSRRSRAGQESYCALGAIRQAATGDVLDAHHPLVKRARTALREVVGGNIPTWNDKAVRTKDSVLQAFNQAIRNLSIRREAA
jgi:hypothetical protein